MTTGTNTPMPQVQPLSPSEERTWASIAHLSVLLNLVTGLLGVVLAALIYFIFRDRSRYVAYQALQSVIFQLIWWAGGGVILGIIWAIVGVLSIVFVGIALIPIALAFTALVGLMPLAALVYGVIGGIQTSQGQDFKYWLIGDWVRGSLTGQ